MPTIDGVLNGLLRLALPAAAIAAAVLAVIAVLDHLDQDRRAAERRALLARNGELTTGALAPGSALACLDGGAGEAVENACEKAVFADPQSAAAAVAYMAARLTLLTQASALVPGSEPSFFETFAATRRAVELDRYGIAAHVLADRDGCTAERCAAFALLRDTAALKANLKARAFETYVARYAAAWDKPAAEKQVPIAGATAPAPAPLVGASEPPAASGQPVSSKYDFPSAASIPPVSIMNAEPPLPKAADAPAAPADGAAAAAATKPPVPPKRPQAQAATPPAR